MRRLGALHAARVRLLAAPHLSKSPAVISKAASLPFSTAASFSLGFPVRTTFDVFHPRHNSQDAQPAHELVARRCDDDEEPLAGTHPAVFLAVAGFHDRGFEEAQEIGRGASAVVYAARSKVDGGRYALKVVPTKLHESADRREIFREARIMAQTIPHPNVARYYSSWVAEEGTLDEALVLQLELLGSGASSTMSRWLVGQRSGGAARALEILRDAAAGCAALHKCGIVHRDVKPSNLVLVDGESRSAVVCDLGLAASTRPSSSQGGGAEVVTALGTPTYASPEQLRGACAPLPSSDVFSLGILLAEALHPSFSTGSERAHVLGALRESGTPPTSLRGEARQLVARCCSLDPGLRPDADEVALALGRMMTNEARRN